MTDHWADLPDAFEHGEHDVHDLAGIHDDPHGAHHADPGHDLVDLWPDDDAHAAHEHFDGRTTE